ncbi:hypothetical protein DID80_07690 [Candidatus Marinamargulisbacteria bacterium SCGC AAA071-K20]|nr:hypothetical protein DID80_07690 [Candidatus Marinamargulisbacteria bacterium SCGC AAA071-K20]
MFSTRLVILVVLFLSFYCESTVVVASTSVHKTSTQIIIDKNLYDGSFRQEKIVFNEAVSGNIDAAVKLFKMALYNTASESLPEFMTILMISDYPFFKQVLNSQHFSDFDRVVFYRIMKIGIADYLLINRKILMGFHKNVVEKYSNDNFIKKCFTEETLGYAKAESTLSGQYSASNLVDGDVTTTWAEGSVDAGLYEHVFILNQYSNLVRNTYNKIVFYTGYTKNKETFYDNNRLKKIYLNFSNGNWRTVEFEDTIEPQEIIMDKSEISWLKITILEVYEGKKYNNTCISEVAFLYDSDLAKKQYEVEEKQKEEKNKSGFFNFLN